jgi:hypothetical protein
MLHKIIGLRLPASICFWGSDISPRGLVMRTIHTLNMEMIDASGEKIGNFDSYDTLLITGTNVP